MSDKQETSINSFWPWKQNHKLFAKLYNL